MTDRGVLGRLPCRCEPQQPRRCLLLGRSCADQSEMGDDAAPRQAAQMPWGLNKLRPGSLEGASKQKLQAFSVGRMGVVRKKNPFELKKEAEEAKKRVGSLADVSCVQRGGFACNPHGAGVAL